MAEIRLPPARKGFEYVVGVEFEAGFLHESESVRARLRKFPGAVEVSDFEAIREGDTVYLTLSDQLTEELGPGLYVTELIFYVPTDPTIAEIPFVDNVIVLEVDYSPSA